MFTTRLAWILMVTAMVAPAANADWIPTNFGNGADAEVRESAPTDNRGASTELGLRVANDNVGPVTGSDRNSAIYLRFDLSGTAAPQDFTTALRMTYRNNNLTGPRIQDMVTPNPAVRTGLVIYGLDPARGGGHWQESTITYNTAPGMTPDGDVGTKDFNDQLTMLGAVTFPEIGDQNHLPVGQQLIFTSALLDQFVGDAVDAGVSEVTLVATLIHSGDSPFVDWLNLNYLFNPKEQVTLNADAGYDADVTDPNNPLGSPFSGASNSDGLYSPSLLITPEPGTAVLGLLALAGWSGVRRRPRGCCR